MLQPVPLTTFRGIETHPSFSPDGNQVAFAWSGVNLDNRNRDIYVRQIGTEDQRRLTTHPARDTAPAWSPIRQEIAFVRIIEGDQAEIRLIPSRGRPDQDQEVTDIILDAYPPWGTYRLTWSSDGRWLAISAREKSGEPTAIYLVSISSGKKQRMTWPPAGGYDMHPAFSPDSRRLAFSRRGRGAGQIYLLSLSEDYQAAGEPEPLTHEPGVYAYPVWTLDGGEIIVVFGKTADTRLHRIPVRDPEGMRPLNVSHEVAAYPALSAQGDRLAFAEMTFGGGILRVELPGPGVSWGSEQWKPQEFALSTRQRGRASYSHDGKKIAYASKDSGITEIWTCNSDGSAESEFQVTRLNGAVSQPRWSPHGESISFFCSLEGNAEICVISSGGGDHRNLTQHPANDNSPSWSRDGQWIYFSSDRSGDRQIWKIPAAGGDAERVTDDGGRFALESPDGQTLFFSRDVDDRRSLWRVPAQGGQARYVADLRQEGATRFSVADWGVYFFSDASTLWFLPFDSAEATPIVSGLRMQHARLWSVSPDGRWALLNEGVFPGSDLMLVENFR